MENQSSPVVVEKKTRKRRSPEKMAELVLEAERVGAALVCRRENIQPAQLSRWRQKFLMGGVASLRELKRGPKPQENQEVSALKAETERLKTALVETSIELQAIKKSGH
jgi:transposase-like protein